MEHGYSKILSLISAFGKFFIAAAFILTSGVLAAADFFSADVSTGYFISPQFSTDETKINAIVYGLKADNQGSIIRITEPFVFIAGETITALKDVVMVTDKETKPTPYPLKSSPAQLRKFWNHEIHHKAQAWIFSSDTDAETDDARLDLNTKNLTGDKNAFFRSRQLDADGVAFNCYLPNQKIHIKSDVHVLLRNDDVVTSFVPDSELTPYDVEIIGDEMDLDLENNVATIIKNVVVTIPGRNESISCDKMIITMKKNEDFTSLFAGDGDAGGKDVEKGKKSKSDDSDDSDETIRQIEFIGNVIYSKHAVGFKALADDIVYDNIKKNIVMSCLPDGHVHIISGEDTLDCSGMTVEHVSMVSGTTDSGSIIINATSPRLKLHGNMLSSSSDAKNEKDSDDSPAQTTAVSSLYLNYREEDKTCRFTKNVEVETSDGEIINCNDMQILFNDSDNTFASAFEEVPEDAPDSSAEAPSAASSANSVALITCTDNVLFITDDMKILGDFGVYVPESVTDDGREDGSITVTCKNTSSKDVHCYQDKNKLDCSGIVVTLKENSRTVHADRASIRYIVDNKPNIIEEESSDDGKRHAKMPVVTATASKIPLLIEAPILDMDLSNENAVREIIFRGVAKQQVDTLIMDDGSRIICDVMTINPVENNGVRELDSIVCSGNFVYSKPVSPSSAVVAEKVIAEKAVYYQDKPMILTAAEGKKVEYENFQDGMKTLSDFITYDISRETIKLHNTKEAKPQEVICNFGQHRTWSDELILCTKNNSINAANVRIRYFRGDVKIAPSTLTSAVSPVYLDINADSMDYSDEVGKIVFYGDVKTGNLKNSGDKLTCTHMEIALEDKADAPPREISSNKAVNSVSSKSAKYVKCFGSPISQVVYANPGSPDDPSDPPVTAKCDEAEYSIALNRLNMDGHGYFNRSGIVNNFEDAIYDIETGCLVSRDNDTLIKNLNLNR